MNNEQIKSITGDITPLPWDAAYGSSGNFGIYQKEDIDRAITIPITHISPLERVNETDKANAAYIVKACNEYPSLKLLNNELVEALEGFISLTKNISNDFNFPILEKAKELINKAQQ